MAKSIKNKMYTEFWEDDNMNIEKEEKSTSNVSSDEIKKVEKKLDKKVKSLEKEIKELKGQEDIKPVNPPRGWHSRNEFIDEVGNKFEKGVYVGKVDEPKKDEPKKDEPKKDEPKKDEPKKDEPKKDLNLDEKTFMENAEPVKEPLPINKEKIKEVEKNNTIKVEKVVKVVDKPKSKPKKKEFKTVPSEAIAGFEMLDSYPGNKGRRSTIEESYEPVYEQPKPQTKKPLTQKDIYQQYINDGDSFKIYHRGSLIFDSKVQPRKNYPIFQDTDFILFGKNYIYRGIRIEKY